jgi:hypothetical protein
MISSLGWASGAGNAINFPGCSNYDRLSGQMPDGFGGWSKSFYTRKLEWFVEGYLADLMKTLLVLAGLMIFQGFTYGMKVMGYDKEAVHQLEQTHFWPSYATLMVIPWSFFLRLLISIFRSDNPDA